MAALARVGAKVALASGAVYVTLNEGVWSSGSFGSKALEKVRTTVLPTANDMVNKMPALSDLCDKSAGAWNSGMKATFCTLSQSPTLAVEYGTKAVDYVKTSLK